MTDKQPTVEQQEQAVLARREEIQRRLVAVVNEEDYAFDAALATGEVLGFLLGAAIGADPRQLPAAYAVIKRVLNHVDAAATAARNAPPRVQH
jgi:hypothetical protein